MGKYRDKQTLILDEITFAQKFLELKSASAAYRHIKPRCSTESVYTNAWRMLRREGVRRYIRQLQRQACDVAGLTLSNLVQTLSRDVFMDRTRMFDAAGYVLPLAKDLWSIVSDVTLEQTTGKQADRPVSGNDGNRWYVGTN